MINYFCLRMHWSVAMSAYVSGLCAHYRVHDMTWSIIYSMTGYQLAFLLFLQTGVFIVERCPQFRCWGFNSVC